MCLHCCAELAYFPRETAFALYKTHETPERADFKGSKSEPIVSVSWKFYNFYILAFQFFVRVYFLHIDIFDDNMLDRKGEKPC